MSAEHAYATRQVAKVEVTTLGSQFAAAGFFRRELMKLRRTQTITILDISHATGLGSSTVARFLRVGKKPKIGWTETPWVTTYKGICDFFDYDLSFVKRGKRRRKMIAIT